MEGSVAIQTAEAEMGTGEEAAGGAFEVHRRSPEATVADVAATAVERWDATPMTTPQLEAHTAFVKAHYGQLDHMGG